MFENIGGKIKSFVKITFGIEVFLCVVLAFALKTSLSILILPIGIFLAWISTFLLYGYGELIENAQKQTLQNQKLLQLLSGESVDIDTSVQNGNTSFRAMSIPRKHVDKD